MPATCVVAKVLRASRDKPVSSNSLLYKLYRSGATGYRKPPDCWSRFSSPISMPKLVARSDTEGCIFLHLLRSGSTERIVMVTWVPELTKRPLFDAVLQATTFIPGTWERTAEFEGSWPDPITGGSELSVRCRQTFIMFSGQPDPLDSSHFSVSYELDGVQGIIDGCLHTDGLLAFQIRKRSK